MHRPDARPRARVLIETLEPRILYSADLAAVASVAGGEVALTQELRLQGDTALAAQVGGSTEIAFVDLGVPDAHTLVGGLEAQRAQGRPIEIVTFTSTEDGLAVISRTLSERQADGIRFDAVHVFSHGRAGAVQLGATALDADSLLRRAGEIAGWSGALGAQADLLLYGCDVADGAGGLFLVEGLAALTGADVAASDDPTGSAARGGDWLLERHAGQIEAAVALDVAAQQAWSGTLGSEITVNTTTGGNQNTSAEVRGSQQSVAMDAAGNYTVVWTGPESGGGKGVFLRRFAYDGTALGGEVLVNTTMAKDQENARIVGDGTGRFAVVWTSQDQDGTTASVYFRRFAADGTATTGEIRANASDTGDQLNAVIGMNATNGDLVVAWEGDGPGGQSVFFRRFALDGRALDAVDRVAGALNSEINPAVAMDATGRFVIAWQQGQHVYFQRFDATGAPAGVAIQVDNAASDSICPAVAMNDQGSFVIAYREQTTLPGIWGRAFQPDGTPRGVWFHADTGDASSPSVSMAADGSAVVVYQKSGDGGGKGVYATRIGTNGLVDGTPFQVNQYTSGDQISASVVMRDSSHFVVAWSGDNVDDKDGISARTFEPAGTAPLITTNGGGSTAAVSVAENTTAVTTVGAGDADWPLQTVTYSIVGGVDRTKFSIDAQSGALRFVAAPNFEIPSDVGLDNVYEVVVQASDGLLGSTQALAVTVTDVDDQVTAVDDTVSTPYQTAVTVDVGANDLLGTGAALTLLDLDPPAHGKAEIVGGSVVYTPDAGFVGTDTLRYRVIDGSEGLGQYWAMDEPLAGAVTDPALVDGVLGRARDFDGVDDAVRLSGVGYSREFTLAFWFKLDSNSGTDYQYLYAHQSGATQNSLNVYFIEDATPVSTRNNQLRTALIDGNDGTAAADISTLDVDVTAAGLADSRWHLYTLSTRAGVGSSVYIDGTLRATSSHGGDALVPAGTDVVLGGSYTLSATRYFTGALDDIQIYGRTLGAAEVAALVNGPGDIGTVTVTVTPVNDHAPLITSDGGGSVGTPTVAENSSIVTTVTATDADVGGPALRYAIVGGEDRALFSIDASSGLLTFVTAPDAEAPTDASGDNVYLVDVEASDGVHATTQSLKVSVTDVNEHAVGPITDADARPDEVDENAATGTATGLIVQASDADASLNAITYTLDDSAGGRFAIDGATGVVSVAGPLDAEAGTSHRITVRASSSDGSSQTQILVLTVRDLDEFDVSPPLDADGSDNIVREDAVAGALVGLTASAFDGDQSNSWVTYTLTDDAGGRFSIDPTSGVVRVGVGAVLDAESASSHMVEVQARSTDGSLSSQRFTLVIEDVNETAVSAITDQDATAETVREDAAVGTAVGFTALAVDADATNSAVTYALTDDAGGRFMIDAASGVIRVAAALDAETALNHTVTVQAISADGSSTTRSVSIAVADVNETPISPITDQDAAAETVREDAAIGTVAGFTALAVDMDATNSAVTYALTDDAGGRFAIDAASGVIRVASALDAETALNHTVTVRATSADGSSATRSVGIVVEDVNETAVSAITDQDATAETVREDAAVGTVVGFTALAVDMDATNSAVTYALTDDAGGRFAIDAASGVIRVASALDAETALNHTVTVRATSADGSSATRSVGIAVEDVNETAVSAITDQDAAAETVREDTAVGTVVGFTARAVDADATNSVVSYALTDNAGGRFAIDAASGVIRVAAALDAETAPSHAVTVQATSADGSATSRSVLITVADVNETAISAITDQDAAAQTVREDAAIGTAVGFTALAVDADATNSAVTYALTDDAGGRFVIDAASGVIRVAAALDAETALNHTVTVLATSADGSSATRSVSIAVADVNETAISAITDQDAAAETVREDAAVGTAVGFTARAVDADATNNAVTYALTDNAGGRFAIDAASGVIRVAAALNAETASSHTVTVLATSADGSSATRGVSIAVADVNETAISAITDQDAAAETVREDAAVGTAVGFTARAVDADATNNAVTYSLAINVGGRFGIDANSGVLRVAAALDAEASTYYLLLVRAVSSDGSSSTRWVGVSVQDVNEFDVTVPVDADTSANAVNDNAVVGTRVGITAWSRDADVSPDPIRYALTDDAGGRFAIHASTGVVTLARSVATDGASTQTIMVQATSGDGSTATQAMTVAVSRTNLHAPVIQSDGGGATATLSVLENAAGVLTTVMATDADVSGIPPGYQIVGGADAARFTLDAVTGALRFVAPPDAEAPGDAGMDNRYEVIVQASDGARVDAQTLDIRVLDVNETPISAITDQDAIAETVREDAAVGTAVGFTARAVDADATNSAVTYALTDNAGGRFTIDAASGVIRVAAALDAETALSHSVTVLATSADGSSATRSVGIVVEDVNETPISAITDQDAAAETVREDAAIGTAVGFTALAVDADATNSAVTYALTDDAGGRFAIDAASGVIRVAAALDAETALNHTVTVQATSADGSATNRSVLIAVADLNETPISAITDQDAAAETVREDAALGTAVGFTALAVDADATNSAVTYALTDDAGGRFAIDAVSGVIRVAAALNAETALNHTVTVQATSADGSATSRSVAIAVADVNEAAVGSIADLDTAAETVREDAAVGTVVGFTARAVDADATNSAVTYALTDDAGGRFAIDAASGVIRVAAALNAETALNHTVIVQATSADGSATSRSVAIAVADVNEAAVGSIADLDTAAETVREDAAVGTAVGFTARAVDADATNSAVTYALTDDAGGRFSIDAASGVIRVAAALNAETALSHTVTVQATSADGSTATRSVGIAVEDVNETAVSAITDQDATTETVREDVAVGTAVGFTARAVDADATNSAVTYALTDDAGGRFTIDAASGVVTVARPLDAETAQQHDIVLQARSADGSAQMQRVTIAVHDVDEFDVSAIVDDDAAPDRVAEDAALGTVVGFTARAVDADATGSAIAYTLDDDAGGRFAIDAATGVVRVARLLDAEAAIVHTLVVRATSADGSQSTQVCTLQVTDVDEFDLQSLVDTDPAPDSVAEDAAVGSRVGLSAWSLDADLTASTVRYALLDDAGGRFAIDTASGVITVAAALDAETAPRHVLVVQALSADGSQWTQAFGVEVRDVDEFDLTLLADADPAPDTVAEDAAIGSTVGLRGQAVDADRSTSGVTYRLDDTAGGRFAVDPSTGVVTLARALLDEDVAVHTLVLRATSEDGSTVAAAFTVAVRAVNGQAPVIDSDGGGDSAVLRVDEGQTAVTRIVAHDGDLPAETLRHAIVGGADAAAFVLDPLTGQLRFQSAPDADAPRDQDADNVYELTVQVSDGLHTDEQALRVAVQPINDHAPVITSDGGTATALRHVDENTLLVTQAQARDADLPADTLRWRVSGGADAALFSIDADTGVLRWRAAPDRETPLDAGADGVYEVTLGVDDGRHVAEQTLSVVVDDIDEVPRLLTATLAVAEGGEARPVLLAQDVDTPADALVYTVTDLSGGQFERLAVPGEAVMRFTQAEVDAGGIRFVADGGEAAPTASLALSDGTAALAPQALAVAFTPVNDLPVVRDIDLGHMDEDGSRVITAAEWLSTARDADGDALSVSALRLTTGEGTLTDLGDGRWRFDPAPDWQGAVRLVAEVSDGQATVSLTASLAVQAVNDAPRIVSGGGAAVLVLDQQENAVEVTTVAGTDIDATAPLRYAVAGGADAALFRIDATTGVLSFVTPPDHEHPADADGDGRYDLVVEAGDGELVARQTLQIQVGNVDEAPAIQRNVLMVSDATTTLVLQASDPDTPATALTYHVEVVQGGQFERAAAPGTAVLVFTQAELDAGEVVWVAPAGRASALFVLRLSDGQTEVRIGSPDVERQMPVLVVSTLSADSPKAETPAEAVEPEAAVAGPGTAHQTALPPAPPTSAGDAGLGLGLQVVDESPRTVGVRTPDVTPPVTRSLSALAGDALLVAQAEVMLDLPSESSLEPRRQVGGSDLWSSRSGLLLVEEMDRLRQEVAEAQHTGVVSLASAALVSTGLSVGYVIWLVRGGVLMTSLMSAMPAWAGLDPLPVLAEMGRGGEDDDLVDDPIEKLFSKARRLLVRHDAGSASSAVAPGAGTRPPDGPQTDACA